MADFDKYSKSVLGKVKLKMILKKYKILIISIASLLSVSTGGFFIADNVFTEKLSIDSTFAYGQEIKLNEPHTVFGAFSHYEFYYPQKGEWLTVTPTLPGEYKVRAISNKLVGNEKASDEVSFTILKKDTSIELKENKTTQKYGSFPTLNELDYSLINGHSINGTINYDVQELTEDKVRLLLDTSSIKVIDNNTRDDVTSCYNFTTTEKELTLTINDSLTITPVISGKVYDEEEITYNLSTNGFNSLYGDTLKVLSYHYLDQSNNIIDAPINAGNYYLVIDNIEVKRGTLDTSSYFNFENSGFKSSFTISKYVVNKPIEDTRTFNFISLENSGKQTYSFTETDYYKLSSFSDSLTQNDVDQYDIVIELKDKYNYIWSNGSSNDLIYPFIINKAKVENPLIDNTVFYYNDGENLVYNTQESTLYTLQTINTRNDVGTYQITYKINDYARYEWATNNGYVNNEYLTYDFVINKKKIDIPIENKTTYSYIKDVEQTYSVQSSTYYTVLNDTHTLAGTYPVTISLNDTNRYEWANGSVSPIVYNFEIKPCTIAKPILSGNFEYGESYTFFTFVDGVILKDQYDNETINQSSLTQQAVGTYSGYIHLDSNYIWNTNTSETLFYTFTITKNVVTIPTKDTKTFIYTGSPLTYSVYKNDDIYTVTGDTKTNAYDTTKVKLSLNNKDSYVWSNGSSDDIEWDFIINPFEIIAPKNNTTSLYRYNGSSQDFNLIEDNESKSLYEIYDSSLSFVNAGSYTLKFKIKDDFDNDNYVWNEANLLGNKDRRIYEISITVLKAQIEDTYQNYSVEFDNTKKSYTIATQDIYEIVNKEFVTDITNPTNGPITVTIKIKDDKYNNYEWKNISGQTITKSFEITSRVVTNPYSNSLVLNYDGSASYKLSLIEDALDKSFYNVYLNGFLADSDNMYVNNAGEYIVTYSLKYPDYSIFTNPSSQSLTFTVNKEVVPVPTSSQTSLVYNKQEQTFSYSIDSNYSSYVEIVSGDSTLKGTYVSDGYQIVFRITNSNYIFANNLNTYTIDYSITPYKVTKPTTLTNNKVPYDGESHTFTPSGFDSDWMKITGSNTETNYKDSSYTFSVELIDTDNTVWNDLALSVTPIEYSFKIVLGGVDASMFAVQTTKHYYTGNDQTYFDTLPSGNNVTYTITGNTQRDLANITPHTVTVSLAPGYKWTDTETTEDRTFDFYIYKNGVEIPTLDNYSFDYTGETIIVSSSLATNNYYWVNNINNQVDAGTYSIELVLKDNGLYTEWIGDEDKTTIYIDYTINKIPLSITSASKEKTYDGTILSNNTIVSSSGLLTGDTIIVVTSESITNAGTIDNTQTYKVLNSLTQDVTKNYQITATPGTLKINKKDITVTPILDLDNNKMQYTCSPYSFDTSKIYKPFVYNTSTLTIDSVSYKIKNTLSSVSPTNVGTYVMNVTGWGTSISQETLDNYNLSFAEVEFEITRAPIAKPTANVNTFTYTGSPLTYTLDTGYYTLNDNTKTNAGSYKVKVSVDSNHKWNDDTTADLSYDFVINKQEVAVPTAKDNLIFSESYQDLLYLPYDYESYYSISISQGKEVDNYTVTCTLIDKDNYKWTNLDSNDQNINVTISPKPVTKPSSDSRTFIYDGTIQTYLTYSSTEYQISGTTSKTNVGTNTITYSLKTGYVWSDNTTSDVTYNFVISKRPITLSLNEFSAYTFNESSQSVTPAFTNPGSYSIVSGHTIIPNFTIKKGDNTVPSLTTAGTYSFTLNSVSIYSNSVDVTSNYDITLQNKERSITVNKLNVEFILTKATTLIYDGSNHNASNITNNYYFKNLVNEASSVNLTVNNLELYFDDGENHDLSTIKNVNTYDAKVKSLVVNNEDDYNVTYSSSYTEDYIKIDYKKIEVPTSISNLKYDGTNKTLINTISNYQTYYTVDVLTGLNAGTYTSTIVLNPNYSWDRTTDPFANVVLNTTIAKRTLQIRPKAKTITYGESYTVGTDVDSFDILNTGDSVLASDKSHITINIQYRLNSEVVTPSNSGEYITTIGSVSYNDGRDTNYQYVSNSSTLTINKVKVTIPQYNEYKVTYNSSTNNYTKFTSGNVADTAEYSLNFGFISAVNVGTYYTYLTLTDTINHEWSDGTTLPITITHVINKNKVTIPQYNEYTEIYKSSTNNLTKFTSGNVTNTAEYTLSFDFISAVNVGTYNTYLTLTDTSNNEWSDGTTSQIKITHVINKYKVAVPTGLTSKMTTISLTLDSIENPTLHPVMFTYTDSDDASYYNLVVKDSNNNTYDVSEGFKKKGTYTFSFVLVDNKNTEFKQAGFENNVYTIVVEPFIIDTFTAYDKKYTSEEVDFLGTSRTAYNNYKDLGYIDFDNSTTKGTDVKYEYDKNLKKVVASYDVELSIKDAYKDKIAFTGGLTEVTVDNYIRQAVAYYSFDDIEYEYGEYTSLTNAVIKSLTIDKDKSDNGTLFNTSRTITYGINGQDPDSYEIGKFNLSIYIYGSDDDSITKNYTFISYDNEVIIYKKAPTIYVEFKDKSLHNYSNPYSIYYINSLNTKVYGSESLLGDIKYNTILNRSYNSQNYQVYSIDGLGTYTLDLTNSTFTDMFNNDLSNDITIEYINDISYVSYLEKNKVAIPTLISSEFDYTGNTINLTFDNNQDSALYTMNFNSVKDAGEYLLQLELIKPELNEWNGTYSDYSITVNKKELSLSFSDIEKLYNGKTFTLLTASSSTYEKVSIPYTISGLLSGHTFALSYFTDSIGKEPGEYEVKFSYDILDSQYNSVISNYDILEPYSSSITFTINYDNANTVPKPSNSADTSFTGSIQTFVLNVTDTSLYDLSNNVSFKRLNAGTYKFKVVPKTGYVWSDSKTRDEVEVTWTITPVNITFVLNDTFYFDGNTHTSFTSLSVDGGSLHGCSVYSYNVYSDPTREELLETYLTGSYKTYLDSEEIIIVDPNNTDVTDSFNISVKIGKITVNRIDLTIDVSEAQGPYQYDGTEKKYYGNIVSTGLLSGHNLYTEFTGYSSVGTYKTTPSYVEITDAGGEDVTSCYRITYVTTTYQITINTTASVVIKIPTFYETIGESYTIENLQVIYCSGLIGNDTLSSVTVSSKGGSVSARVYIYSDNEVLVTKNYQNVSIIFED